MCDVREKLCQTEAQKSDAMEPKQTDSVTDTQKSDVCNEINKSDEVEQPEKLCAADEKSDAMNQNKLSEPAMRTKTKNETKRVMNLKPKRVMYAMK